MPHTQATPNILVVDDDQGLLILIEGILRAEKWNVVTAASGTEAMAWLHKNPVDLMVLDLKLKDITGRELVAELGKAGKSVPFIVVTGQGDERVAVEMMKRGALDYLVKDISFLEFVPAVIKRALARLADEKRLAQAEAEANESRALTQAVLNSLAANIAVLDREGNIIAVNEPWHKFARENGTSSPSRAVIGTNYLEVCRTAAEQQEPGAEEILAGIQQVMSRAGSDYSVEYPCHSPGKLRWFLMTVTPLSKDDGGVVISHADITSRKLAENALREANEFGKQIISGAQAGIIVCDRAGKIIVWNPFMEQLSGHHSADVLKRHALEVLHALPGQHLGQVFKLALAGKNAEAADIPFNNLGTNKRHWATARFAPWHDSQQNIVGVIIAVRDITDRRRLEAEMLEISDREQRRIGHDLHDGLGQQLTGLEMKNFLLLEDLAAADLTAGRENLQKQAHQMSAALRECVTTTRALARGLAPVDIKAGGLVDALKQLAHNTRIPGKIECRFTSRLPLNIDASPIAGQLYRITQEAVNNALKHARAEHILISLTHSADELRLQIKDDGRGLPKRPKAKTGMGLEVMRHRAHVIGASLEINSTPGQGVCISCTLPFKHHEV